MRERKNGTSESETDSDKFFYEKGMEIITVNLTNYPQSVIIGKRGPTTFDPPFFGIPPLEILLISQKHASYVATFKIVK